jgi:Holliday junction resolvase RusA-like endonuclease
MNIYTFRIFGEPMPNRSPRSQIIFGKIPKEIVNRFVTIIDSEEPTGDKIKLILHTIRDRFSKDRVAFVNHYPETEVVNWQNLVTRQLEDQVSQDWDLAEEPLTGPLEVTLWIYQTRPKSNRFIYPDTKPDYDNFVKPINDCLEGKILKSQEDDGKKGQVIENDSRIVDAHVFLRWAYLHYEFEKYTEQKPGVIIELRTIDTLDASKRRELNSQYRNKLTELDLEYRKVVVGRGKNAKIKTILDEVF